MHFIIPKNKKLRVAISGRSGCGNTTVSKLLSEVLGISMINFTFRQLAEEEGLTLAEVIERAKNDESYDVTVDTRQVELALKDSCILGSRLAIWMLKEADFKIFLDASADVRASRILKREGGDIEEIKRFTAMRDAEDSARYKQLYNINNADYAFCDLIIDTSQFTPEQICANILEELCSRGLIEKSVAVQ